MDNASGGDPSGSAAQTTTNPPPQQPPHPLQQQPPPPPRHAVRSRTSSTGSIVGQQGLPPGVVGAAAGQPGAAAAAAASFDAQLFNRGVRCPSVEQLSASSRSSSIPPTPAPTPNPLLHVTNHGHLHEQLVAGIQQLKGDEGIDVDGTSFPVTPAPSPFCPSPGAAASVTLHQIEQPSPAQVVEGIQRLGGLRSNSFGAVSGIGIPNQGILSRSGSSTGQPPTPSTTPGLQAAAAFGFPQAAAVGGLGIIPEHLAESIHRSLRVRDEGLDSTSSPGTPVPTPISPGSLSTSEGKILPEQIAAGIHRLKVEEGMSSGGSSGFPSTPAPTPFSHHPGGVRPEDLAAGISRLSVIEETDGMSGPTGAPLATNPPTRGAVPPPPLQSQQSAPSLSQYFSKASESVTDHPLQQRDSASSQAENFFDQLTSEELKPAKPQQNQQAVAKGDGSSPKPAAPAPAPQSPTAPVVCNIFSAEKTAASQDNKQPPSSSQDPFDNLTIGSARKSPTTLTLSAADPAGSTTASSYATPVAPTPTQQTVVGYSTHTTPAPPFLTPQPPPLPPTASAAVKKSPAPITSPLPMMSPAVAAPLPVYDASAENFCDQEEPQGAGLWLPCPSTVEALANPAATDASLLTAPGVQVREEFSDPVRSLVSHYRGDAEASKRQVLTANTVSQDMNGLCQLVRTGNYRAAVNLTARLLHSFNQGVGKAGSPSRHTPLSLKIWYIRFSVLVKLKQFSTVEVESETFGDLDKPDLYYEFYPAAAASASDEGSSPSTGSMVPFGLRLLLAELPQHLNKPHEATDRLARMLFVVRKLLARLKEDPKNAASLELWRIREIQVLRSIVNCALLQKDFDVAVSTLDTIYENDKLSGSEKAGVKSSLGRVYLQLGDLIAASLCFAEAKKMRETASCLDQHMDDAMLAVAKGDFDEALTALGHAKAIEPQNPAVVNNMSVCLLYTGKLSQALALLEGHLTNDPADFLRETQVLNLATLYELESSYASQKKQSLLDFVARYAGDGANTSCLKF